MACHSRQHAGDDRARQLTGDIVETFVVNAFSHFLPLSDLLDAGVLHRLHLVADSNAQSEPGRVTIGEIRS